VAASIALNRFALIDDGVTLLRARGELVDAFRLPDSGRYVPFYWAFHWLLMRVLPEQPWSFSLANAGFLLVAAWQVQRLGQALWSPLAGIVAAWLFGLNLSTVENAFTLGKAEPKQVVFWLAALILLGRAQRGTDDRMTPFEAPCMVLCVLAATLFKETAVLLWAPLSLFAGLTLRSWSDLQPADRRRRVRLVVAAAIPLAMSTCLVLSHGVARGSYARERIISGPSLQPLGFPAHDALLASVLAAGLVGGIYLLVRPHERALVGLLSLQLAVVVVFFGMLRVWMPYVYLTAMALAAVLLSAALVWLGRRRLAVQIVVGSVILFLVVGGIARSVAGGSALAGWSRLYERLTQAVVVEQPRRVVFYRSGSWETHIEARTFWEFLHNIPLTVAVLEADAEPGIPSVSFRDLRPGDWILEQFGTARNVDVPFRDVGVTRPLAHGLISPAGGGLLPLRLLHDFRARFPLPPRGLAPLGSARSQLQWRISEVTDVPRVALTGLDDDHWMRASASIWIRAGAPGPFTLHFFPFVHGRAGEAYDNELMVLVGDVLIARCPARDPAVSRCTFEPAAAHAGVGGESWSRFSLRAANVFSPRALGASPDPRELSFNLGPTWERGVAGILGTAERGPGR
jgi:hypothetical protein